MNYVQEQEEWDQFVWDSLGHNATLVSVSQLSSDQRVYRTDDAIVKIRKVTPASMRARTNSLEDESLILQHLSSVPGVPTVRRYTRMREWEQLELDVLPDLCSYDPSFGKPREAFKDFWDVVQVTMRMNRLGCSHGDLHWQKVRRNVAGGISVFGLDQACMTSPWRCAARDILGLSVGVRGSEFSLLNRRPRARGRIIEFWRRVKAKLARELNKVLPRTGPSTTQSSPIPKATFVQCAKVQADPAFETLAEAWSIASRSKASAGSYYSLDIGGINFPGERPWILRWERIRTNVDFKGKRVLELGCNMGLLSIHAKLSGAACCLGIDAHKDILQAADLASRAFETDAEFRQLQLDDPSPWEEELHGFDMVTALSVLYWCKNKERVWSFISRHKEVLYEGHESEEEVEGNLMKAGFRHIVRLGKSERNRQMFYASQTREEVPSQMLSRAAAADASASRASMAWT